MSNEYMSTVQQQDVLNAHPLLTEALLAKKTLLDHPYVEQALVAEHTTENDPFLVAFFTARQYFNMEELTGFLKDRLPPNAIPGYFIYLQKFPVLPDGSIDAPVLLKDVQRYIDGNAAFQVPASQVEFHLAAIWSQVLDKTRISVNDNFFKSTGNSLKAIQIVSRMHKMGYKVTLKDIFNQPTIKQLAAIL